MLKCLEGDRSHPTVDEIYGRLKKKYPTISLATVYSSLESLKEAGEIQELSIRKEKTCFDPEPSPHHHFFCRKCSKVMDIEIDINCPMHRKVESSGYIIEEAKAYFYGICSRCNKKGK